MTRVQYRSIVKTYGNNQSSFLKRDKDENNSFDLFVAFSEHRSSKNHIDQLIEYGNNEFDTRPQTERMLEKDRGNTGNANEIPYTRDT